MAASMRYVNRQQTRALAHLLQAVANTEPRPPLPRRGGGLDRSGQWSAMITGCLYFGCVTWWANASDDGDAGTWFIAAFLAAAPFAVVWLVLYLVIDKLTEDPAAARNRRDEQRLDALLANRIQYTRCPRGATLDRCRCGARWEYIAALREQLRRAHF